MIQYSVVIISYKRDDALQENLGELARALGQRDNFEVIFVDNNEDDYDRSAMLTGFRHHTYTKPGRNCGVAGGRNIGIAQCQGSILIFLDDDAFISPTDFPDRIGRLFDGDRTIGIIAFRSTNFYTKRMDPAEFPHTNKGLDPNVPFKTFRFIGVGHAIRREVFDVVGTYDNDFFYGMEEFDLSFRAIKAGFEILYTPDVAVLHKKNPAGRLPSTRVIEQSLRNKLCVNYMHLPLPFAIASTLLWTGHSLWRSRGRANILAVYIRFLEWARKNAGSRNAMGPEALAYVRKCGGQLWK